MTVEKKVNKKVNRIRLVVSKLTDVDLELMYCILIDEVKKRDMQEICDNDYNNYIKQRYQED